MASEEHEETTVTVSVPRDLQEWVDDQATAAGLDRDAVVVELLAAYRDVAGAAAIEDLLDDVETVPRAVEDRLEEHRGEFMDLLEDVRERVIQVKRETDEKAPAEDLAALEDDLAALSERLESAESERADLQSQVERGFENYEDVVEGVVDAVDDLEARVEALTDAVVDARNVLRQHADRERARAEAAALKRAANQLGVRAADCGGCGERVAVGLLSAPRCPHCEATFSDVRAKDRFFGSNVLVTGDPPALEAPPDLDEAADPSPDDSEEP